MTRSQTGTNNNEMTALVAMPPPAAETKNDATINTKLINDTRKDRSKAFLRTTYDMVETETILRPFSSGENNKSKIISWSNDGTSFLIYNAERFTEQTIPKYYQKKNKFETFTRQLNSYGFTKSKVMGGFFEFSHEKFIRGHTELLCEIQQRPRKKYATASQKQHQQQLAVVSEAEEEEEVVPTATPTNYSTDQDDEEDHDEEAPETHGKHEQDEQQSLADDDSQDSSEVDLLKLEIKDLKSRLSQMSSNTIKLSTLVQNLMKALECATASGTISEDDAASVALSTSSSMSLCSCCSKQIMRKEVEVGLLNGKETMNSTREQVGGGKFGGRVAARTITKPTKKRKLKMQPYHDKDARSRTSASINNQRREGKQQLTVQQTVQPKPIQPSQNISRYCSDIVSSSLEMILSEQQPQTLQQREIDIITSNFLPRVLSSIINNNNNKRRHQIFKDIEKEQRQYIKSFFNRSDNAELTNNSNNKSSMKPTIDNTSDEMSSLSSSSLPDLWSLSNSFPNDSDLFLLNNDYTTSRSSCQGDDDDPFVTVTPSSLPSSRIINSNNEDNDDVLFNLLNDHNDDPPSSMMIDSNNYDDMHLLGGDVDALIS